MICQVRRVLMLLMQVAHAIHNPTQSQTASEQQLLLNNIQEEEPTDPQKERILQWFSMHDNNSDGYLDGHELLLAFSESLHANEDPETLESINQGTWALLEPVVDGILRHEDTDFDGRISAQEFLNGAFGATA